MSLEGGRGRGRGCAGGLEDVGGRRDEGGAGHVGVALRWRGFEAEAEMWNGLELGQLVLRLPRSRGPRSGLRWDSCPGSPGLGVPLFADCRMDPTDRRQEPGEATPATSPAALTSRHRHTTGCLGCAAHAALSSAPRVLACIPFRRRMHSATSVQTPADFPDCHGRDGVSGQGCLGGVEMGEYTEYKYRVAQ